jgi:hypothetical protein
MIASQWNLGPPQDAVQQARLGTPLVLNSGVRALRSADPTSPCRAAVGSSRLFAWNEFPFALTFINESNLKTLPVGLLELQGALTTNWPVLFAGLAIASIPMILVFIAGQRHFIRGLAEGFGK